MLDLEREKKRKSLWQKNNRKRINEKARIRRAHKQIPDKQLVVGSGLYGDGSEFPNFTREVEFATMRYMK